MAHKVKVRKVNNSVLGIECDLDQKVELKEFFSFYANNYKFSPKFRKGFWDGKIRLFNTKSQTLPVGLFYKLKKFCKDRNYEMDLIEDDEFGSPENYENIPEKEIDGFLDSLKLPFELYEYQRDAIIKSIRAKRITIKSPTGTGKSVIIYCILKWFLDVEEREKLLLIVPTTSLVEQMYSDFKDYGFNPRKYCHRIYHNSPDFGGTKSRKPIFISTWQSIYELEKDWFEQFEVVIGDEAHGFKANSLVKLMNKCTYSDVRVSLTGTFDNTIVHKLQVEGLFGNIYVATTTREQQDLGRLADLNIEIVKLLYDDVTRETFYNQYLNAKTAHFKERSRLKQKLYLDEIEFLISNKKRNKFICNIAATKKGNTLVLFKFVEKHGKVLYELLQKMYPDRKIYYVHGNVDTDDREYIRKIVEKEKNSIIVASLGTFSTGINIKNLHNIIFASPWKSIIKVLQSIGRSLRLADNRQHSTLVDVWDDLSKEDYTNYAILHGLEKIEIYREEKHKYKLYEIDFK